MRHALVAGLILLAVSAHAATRAQIQLTQWQDFVDNSAERCPESGEEAADCVLNAIGYVPAPTAECSEEERRLGHCTPNGAFHKIEFDEISNRETQRLDTTPGPERPRPTVPTGGGTPSSSGSAKAPSDGGSSKTSGGDSDAGSGAGSGGGGSGGGGGRGTVATLANIADRVVTLHGIGSAVGAMLMRQPPANADAEFRQYAKGIMDNGKVNWGELTKFMRDGTRRRSVIKALEDTPTSIDPNIMNTATYNPHTFFEAINTLSAWRFAEGPAGTLDRARVFLVLGYIQTRAPDWLQIQNREGTVVLPFKAYAAQLRVHLLRQPEQCMRCRLAAASARGQAAAH